MFYTSLKYVCFALLLLSHTYGAPVLYVLNCNTKVTTEFSGSSVTVLLQRPNIHVIACSNGNVSWTSSPQWKLNNANKNGGFVNSNLSYYDNRDCDYITHINNMISGYYSFSYNYFPLGSAIATGTMTFKQEECIASYKRKYTTFTATIKRGTTIVNLVVPWETYTITVSPVLTNEFCEVKTSTTYPEVSTNSKNEFKPKSGGKATYKYTFGDDTTISVESASVDFKAAQSQPTLPPYTYFSTSYTFSCSASAAYPCTITACDRSISTTVVDVSSKLTFTSWMKCLIASGVYSELNPVSNDKNIFFCPPIPELVSLKWERNFLSWSFSDSSFFNNARNYKNCKYLYTIKVGGKTFTNELKTLESPAYDLSTLPDANYDATVTVSLSDSNISSKSSTFSFLKCTPSDPSFKLDLPDWSVRENVNEIPNLVVNLKSVSWGRYCADLSVPPKVQYILKNDLGEIDETIIITETNGDTTSFFIDLTTMANVYQPGKFAIVDFSAKLYKSRPEDQTFEKSQIKFCVPTLVSYDTDKINHEKNDGKYNLIFNDIWESFVENCDSSIQEITVTLSTDFTILEPMTFSCSPSDYQKCEMVLIIPSEVIQYVGYSKTIHLSGDLNNGYSSTKAFETDIELPGPGVQIAERSPLNFQCFKSNPDRFSWALSSSSVSSVSSGKLKVKHLGTNEIATYDISDSENSKTIDDASTVEGDYSWWIEGIGTDDLFFSTIPYRFIVASECINATPEPEDIFGDVNIVRYESLIHIRWTFFFASSKNIRINGVQADPIAFTVTEINSVGTSKKSFMDMSDMSADFYHRLTLTSQLDYNIEICYEKICHTIKSIFCKDVNDLTPVSPKAEIHSSEVILEWSSGSIKCGDSKQTLYIESTSQSNPLKLNIVETLEYDRRSFNINFNNRFADNYLPLGIKWSIIVTLGGRSFSWEDSGNPSQATFTPCIDVTPQPPVISMNDSCASAADARIFEDWLCVDIVNPISGSYRNLCHQPSFKLVFKANGETYTGINDGSGKFKEKAEYYLRGEVKVIVYAEYTSTASGEKLVSEGVETEFNLCVNESPTVELLNQFDQYLPEVIRVRDESIEIEFAWNVISFGQNCANQQVCELFVEVFRLDGSIIHSDVLTIHDQTQKFPFENEGTYFWRVRTKWGVLEEVSKQQTFEVCKMEKLKKTVVTLFGFDNIDTNVNPPLKFYIESDCGDNKCKRSCTFFYELFDVNDLHNPISQWIGTENTELDTLEDGHYRLEVKVGNEFFDEQDMQMGFMEFRVCNPIPPDIPLFKKASHPYTEHLNSLFFFHSVDIEDIIVNFEFSIEISNSNWGQSCKKSSDRNHLAFSQQATEEALVASENIYENEAKLEFTLNKVGRFEFQVVAINSDKLKSRPFTFYVIICRKPQTLTLLQPIDEAVRVWTIPTISWERLDAVTAGYPCTTEPAVGRYIRVVIIPEKKYLAISGEDAEDFIIGEYSYQVSFLADSFEPPRLQTSSKYYWRADVVSGDDVSFSDVRSFVTKDIDCSMIECNTSNGKCEETDTTANCVCFNGYSGSSCNTRDSSVAIAVAVPITTVFVAICIVIVVFFLWKKNRKFRLPKPEFNELRLLPVVPSDRSADLSSTIHFLEKDPDFAFSQTSALIKEAHEADELLLSLFYAYAKTGKDLSFLVSLLLQDIINLPENPFRDTTPGTKVFSHFCRLYGIEYMWHNFHKVLEEFLDKKKDLLVRVKGIDNVSTTSLHSMKTLPAVTHDSTNSANFSVSSFDSTSFDVDVDDDDHKAIYMMLCASKLLNCIVSSRVNPPPPEIVKLLSTLKTEIIEANLDINISTPLLILLLQKFVVPILATGHLGVFPELDHTIKKQLSIIGKLFSRTIIGIPFEETAKPTFLYSCNPFIDQNSDNLHSFVLSLCTSGENLELSNRGEHYISNELYDNCLQVIHKYHEKKVE